MDATGTRQFRMGHDANFNITIGDYGNNNLSGIWFDQFKISYMAPSNSLTINGSGNVGLGVSELGKCCYSFRSLIASIWCTI